ncbi:MAG: glutamate 5-kinase [Spirochaetales bacterium]|nr:glutamate 5-kinase [Spirochaetales bacterium]
MDRQAALARVRSAERIVIKIGSSLLLDPDGRGLDEAMLQRLAGQIMFLREESRQILLVSSGAVALGRTRLHALAKTKDSADGASLRTRQALSTIGQPLLMQRYAELFREKGIPVAQLLITARDFRNRRSYLNIGHTIESLIRSGALPIINENDAVSTAELQFGENDILSAACAALFRAGLLIILTSVEGFLDGAQLIPFLSQITAKERRLARGPEGPGSGGMAAKIRAGELCLASGSALAILPGREKNIIADFLAGKEKGTLIAGPGGGKLSARKRWILYSMAHGTIDVDAGAARALAERGSSLLAAGIRQVDGTFFPGDVVGIRGPEGEVGRGIVNYSSREVQELAGRKSEEHAGLFVRGTEIIHRDNLVLSRGGQ